MTEEEQKIEEVVDCLNDNRITAIAEELDEAIRMDHWPSLLYLEDNAIANLNQAEKDLLFKKLNYNFGDEEWHNADMWQAAKWVAGVCGKKELVIPL